MEGVVVSVSPGAIDRVIEVNAFPNPYTDKISFSVRSTITGVGILELYGLTGERVALLRPGLIEKGVVKTITYIPASPGHKVLLYRLTINGDVTTGKVF